MAVSFSSDFTESAAVGLGTGIKPLLITVRIGEDQVLNSGETITVATGAVSAIAVTVLINGEPATVTSSTWTLNGTLVDLDRSIFTPIKSDIATVLGPVSKQGGIGGNPAVIAAAWVGLAASYPFTVTGTADYLGSAQPFTASGTIVVQCPSLNAIGTVGLVTLTPATPALNGVTQVYIDPDAGQSLGLGVNGGFVWQLTNDDQIPGYVGFTQLATAYTAARTSPDGTEQTKGIFNDADYPALDAVADIFFFYDNDTYTDTADATVTIDVAATEPLVMNVDAHQFTEYVVQYSFETYIVYWVGVQPQVLFSVPVTLASVAWSWQGTVTGDTQTGQFGPAVQDAQQILGALQVLNGMPLNWNYHISAQDDEWR